MAVIVKDKRTGKDKTLLNPREKGNKFFIELRSKEKLTNDLVKKLDRDGKPVGLTDTEASFRNGYLEAQKDARKCYNAKKKIVE